MRTGVCDFYSRNKRAFKKEERIVAYRIGRRNGISERLLPQTPGCAYGSVVGNKKLRFPFTSDSRRKVMEKYESVIKRPVNRRSLLKSGVL